MPALILYSTLRAPPAAEPWAPPMPAEALPQHLAGFAGFVQHATGGRMDARIFAVLQHIRRTRIVQALPESFGLAEACAYAQPWNAIVFDHGVVRDDHGRVLVGPTPDAGAACPYPAAARARKDRSVAILQARGIPVHEGLPPCACEDEVEPRSPQAVWTRLVGLVLVAQKSAGMSFVDLQAWLKALRVQNAFTPGEHGFLANPSPAEHALIQMRWRYESAATLAWSLGLGELPFPTSPCDPAVAIAALQRGAEAKPVPAAAMFDARDLVYRLQWACDDARANRRPPPPGVDTSVVLERLWALHWLLQHGGAAWDDIELHT